MSHYDTMGLSVSATHSEIRDRYLELARLVHPDSGGDPYQFQILSDAYLVLGQPAERARYDASLPSSRTTGPDEHHPPVGKETETRPFARWIADEVEGWLFAGAFLAILGLVAIATRQSFQRVQNIGLVAMVLVVVCLLGFRAWRRHRG